MVNVVPDVYSVGTDWRQRLQALFATGFQYWGSDTDFKSKAWT